MRRQVRHGGFVIQLHQAEARPNNVLSMPDDELLERIKLGEVVAVEIRRVFRPRHFLYRKKAGPEELEYALQDLADQMGEVVLTNCETDNSE